jgi:predicted AAA+ superfamily ATPase
VRDAIVEPAIGRDMLALANVRRPALLRQVFMFAVSSPAQIVSLQKLQGQLQDPGALATIAHYLSLLQEAYLIAVLQKHGPRPARQRAAPPKLVCLNNAYMAALDPRGSPAPEHDPGRWGAWVENACVAFAWSAGQQVSYWREEPHEVDMVTDGDWGKWVIEIKTGSFGAPDVRGLAAFTQRFKGYQPLILCDANQVHAASRLGLPAMSWMRFLLDGPAGAGKT